jgi:hypothetical protein
VERLLLIQRGDVVVRTCSWVIKAHPCSREGRGDGGPLKSRRVGMTKTLTVNWEVGQWRHSHSFGEVGEGGGGCKDHSCSFGEQIGWWWVKKFPPIGLEGRGAL